MSAAIWSTSSAQLLSLFFSKSQVGHRCLIACSWLNLLCVWMHLADVCGVRRVLMQMTRKETFFYSFCSVTLDFSFETLI